VGAFAHGKRWNETQAANAAAASKNITGNRVSKTRTLNSQALFGKSVSPFAERKATVKDRLMLSKKWYCQRISRMERIS